MDYTFNETGPFTAEEIREKVLEYERAHGSESLSALRIIEQSEGGSAGRRVEAASFLPSGLG